MFTPKRPTSRFTAAYWDVSLLIVSKDHIALDHFGGPGVRVTPVVRELQAKVKVDTLVEGSGEVAVSLLDASGRLVAQGSGANASLELEHPHLWDGVR